MEGEEGRKGRGREEHKGATVFGEKSRETDCVGVRATGPGKGTVGRGGRGGERGRGRREGGRGENERRGEGRRERKRRGERRRKGESKGGREGEREE